MGTPGSLLASSSLLFGWTKPGAVSTWAALAWWPSPGLGTLWGGCPSPSPPSWLTIGCPKDAGLDPRRWPSPGPSKQRGKQPRPAPATAGVQPAPGTPSAPVPGISATQQSRRHRSAWCCQGANGTDPPAPQPGVSPGAVGAEPGGGNRNQDKHPPCWQRGCPQWGKRGTARVALRPLAPGVGSSLLAQSKGQLAQFSTVCRGAGPVPGAAGRPGPASWWQEARTSPGHMPWPCVAASHVSPTAQFPETFPHR